MQCIGHALSRLIALTFAALLLAACNGLLDAPVYDAAIEDGLNQYHRDASAFINKTVALGPAGTYDRPESLGFYSQSAGLLNNLAVRAEANDPQGTCAPSQLIASGLKSVLAGVSRQEGVEPQDLSELSSGSCLSISLKAVIVSNGVLERLHKHRNALRPVTAKISQDRIDQAVRLALIQVRAAKP